MIPSTFISGAAKSTISVKLGYCISADSKYFSDYYNLIEPAEKCYHNGSQYVMLTYYGKLSKFHACCARGCLYVICWLSHRVLGDSYQAFDNEAQLNLSHIRSKNNYAL